MRMHTNRVFHLKQNVSWLRTLHVYQWELTHWSSKRSKALRNTLKHLRWCSSPGSVITRCLKFQGAKRSAHVFSSLLPSWRTGHTTDNNNIKQKRLLLVFSQKLILSSERFAPSFDSNYKILLDPIRAQQKSTECVLWFVGWTQCFLYF